MTTTLQTGGETYGQKVWRKLKEEPLIPAFTALTCLALIQASRKMNRGDQQSMNRWLRLRVIAQGATIVALLGYSYVYGFDKFAPVDARHDDGERRKRESERERQRFETRLREVEEIHKAETEGLEMREEKWESMGGVESAHPRSSSSWFSKLWGKKD